MEEPNTAIDNAVVLGGCGAVGSMLADKLAAVAGRVVRVDSRKPCAEDVDIQDWVCGNLRAIDSTVGGVLSNADVVVLALPKEVAEECCASIAACMPAHALMVDTLSVKSRFVEVFRGSGIPNDLLSINPMFAPSVGFEGSNVAVVRLGNSRRSDRFLEILSGWGAHLTFLDADEHDRLAAVVQAATHAAILAFGKAVESSGHDTLSLEPMMTPPQRILLALLARMLGAAPEVYWEIQSDNSCAKKVRADLAAGVACISDVIGGGNFDDFAMLLSGLGKLYDPKMLKKYTDLAERIVSESTRIN